MTINTHSKTIFFFLFTLLRALPVIGQSDFELPDTPASEVFLDFIEAYNTGSRSEIESFVRSNYKSTDSASVAEKTEYWTDIYYRFGPANIHSLSIDKSYDIEVWLNGTISKAWFAPEFILDNDNGKVKATGMLLGMQPENVRTPAASVEQFINRINDYLDANELAGLFQGTVLLQQNGNTIFSKAYGLKNIKQNVKNDPDTRMRFNSVTKPITALAILQLLQQGSLQLNTPVSKYLPELPKHISEKITVYHLLTHTSGYELDGIEGFREELEKTNSMSEVYECQLKYLPAWENYKDFQLTEKWDYSNDSYDLLAIIIEKISGMPFPDYLKKNIFDVAGMDNTSFSKDNEAIPYRYDLKADALTDLSNYPIQLGNVSGASVLTGTTEDLKDLFNLITNTEEIIDGPHKNLFCAPMVRRGDDEYESLGLNISYDVILNYGHSGVGAGSSSDIRYFPGSDLLFIVLCNNRSGAQNLSAFVKNNIPDPK